MEGSRRTSASDLLFLFLYSDALRALFPHSPAKATKAGWEVVTGGRWAVLGQAPPHRAVLCLRRTVQTLPSPRPLTLLLNSKFGTTLEHTVDVYARACVRVCTYVCVCGKNIGQAVINLGLFNCKQLSPVVTFNIRLNGKCEEAPDLQSGPVHRSATYRVFHFSFFFLISCKSNLH